ncbi:MAG: RluA family pseudouridine synthase, partial [Ruminococcus sp.]|nr:RluA family pseudouridine synthase [Ruminococcus sp.]
MAEKLYFTVPQDCGGMTAKWFLKSRCGLSTRMITRLKREKDGILMDGKILRTVDKVDAGASVVISLPEEESSFIEPREGELDIVFEDSHLLVVNKPPYMPVHPAKQHQTDTLANIAVWYAAQKGESYVFRTHNRLDRNTSGLVLIAKDKYSVNLLKNKVRKTYLALVHGQPKEEGTVDAPIGLRDDSKIVRCVRADGS